MRGPSLQTWDGSGVFLLQLDYGYDPLEIVGVRRAGGTLDLALAALGDLDAKLGPEIRMITGADRFLALGRRRGGHGWLESLSSRSQDGILLVARFPRAAQKLASILRARGLFSGSASIEPSGEIPPLYQKVGLESEIGRLHLELEWETGLAHARGATVLCEAAGLMAVAGEGTPAQLAARLGATTGAARSYFGWMAEAGLARKTEGGYALRHPGLALLFLGAKAETPTEALRSAAEVRLEPAAKPSSVRTVLAPPPAQLPATKRWDPSEMD